MCGITACQGKYAAYRAVCMTLAQLDRGTKGSGYAWTQQGEGDGVRLFLAKAPIHPLKVAIWNHYFHDLRTVNAIGHNRMPSRGAVNQMNTHPFIDCKARFALVHNGSLFFSEKERGTMKASGHRILGDTDSEMLCHVICAKLDEGKDMKTALTETVMNRDTAATILILTREGEIWGTKDTFPLELCEIAADNRDGAMVMVASEKSAIETATLDIPERRVRKWTELKRGDVLHLKNATVEVFHNEMPEAVTYATGWMGIDEYGFNYYGGEWHPTPQHVQGKQAGRFKGWRNNKDREDEERRRRGAPPALPPPTAETDKPEQAESGFGEEEVFHELSIPFDSIRRGDTLMFKMGKDIVKKGVVTLTSIHEGYYLFYVHPPEYKKDTDIVVGQDQIIDWEPKPLATPEAKEPQVGDQVEFKTTTGTTTGTVTSKGLFWLAGKPPIFWVTPKGEKGGVRMELGEIVRVIEPEEKTTEKEGTELE